MTQQEKMNFSDNEIEADPQNTQNKKKCSTESTIEKLGGDGFTKKELMLFEAKVTGRSRTIKTYINQIL